MQETQVPPLGREDPLEKELGNHSSIFAWVIPWTEEPRGLQSIESQRAGHDLVTKQQQKSHTGRLTESKQVNDDIYMQKLLYMCYYL